MTPQIKLLIRLFDPDTFTIEIRPSDAITAEDINQAVAEDYIYRHPGIFGSRCSYFLTEKGQEAWQDMYYK
jgi:hypothetical protein